MVGNKRGKKEKKEKRKECGYVCGEKKRGKKKEGKKKKEMLSQYFHNSFTINFKG